MKRERAKISVNMTPTREQLAEAKRVIGPRVEVLAMGERRAPKYSFTWIVTNGTVGSLTILAAGAPGEPFETVLGRAHAAAVKGGLIKPGR